MKRVDKDCACVHRVLESVYIISVHNDEVIWAESGILKITKLSCNTVNSISLGCWVLFAQVDLPLQSPHL